MLDDLDLAWEEAQEPRRRRRGGPPPSRQSKQRRRKERRRKRRSWMALFISMLLLVGLAGAVYYGVGKIQDLFGGPQDYTSTGTATVQITVHNNDNASDIADTLYTAGVIESTGAFISAAASDANSRNIQPGVYQLYKPMPAAAALAILENPKNLVVDKVLITEGMVTVDIFAKLSKVTGVPVADFVAAAKDPVALGVDQSWFAKRSDGTPVITSVEGFLFPDTYNFTPGMTATAMLKAMVAEFNQTISDLDFVNTATKLHITPYEVLIAASIAQAEAVNTVDFAKVARVLYNRAYANTAACNRCLGLDSTTNYWLHITGAGALDSKNLTDAQLHDPNDPFNTHDKPGMPPGAIGNPGKDAMNGALNPVSGSWLYFVSIDKAGDMAYATTESQRLANDRIACQNGVIAC
jgi:UPF0755 protein